MINEGKFSVIRAKRGGKDAIIVVDGKLDPERWARAFPWLITIVLPIRRPNAFGLCDDVESDRLGDVEDRLLSVLEPQDYRYAGRITWDGTREVLIYTAEPDDVISRLQGVARDLEESLEADKEYEPNWDTYRVLVRPLR